MYRLSFILLLFFACFSARAQYYFYDDTYFDQAITGQFGFSGGAMNCVTDLGGKSKSAILKTFEPEGGFYIGALYKRVLGARLEITWGSVTASDRNAKEKGVRQRNLSFVSDITEFSLLAEYHPIDFSAKFNIPASLYILGGVGTFSFNPKAKLKGSYVFLQPLHTEGEGFQKTKRPNYKLSQFMIPIGGGLSYEISPLLTVKGELIYRILNTDYLDDVSTTYINPALFDKNLSPVSASLAKQLFYRGDEVKNGNPSAPVGANRGSSAKDGYYSLNLKLEVTLGRKKIR